MGTTLKKGTEGYGYKYTELADINRYIESIGETYYQYIEPHENGKEYIYTVRCKDGKPIMDPIRGSNVTQPTLSGKTNPAQQQGAGITYARRYSLLMAYGLATTDNDAAEFDGVKPEPVDKSALIQRVIAAGIAAGMDAPTLAAKYKLSDSSDVARLNQVLKELESLREASLESWREARYE